MASELREHGFDVEEHDNLNIESISGAEAIAAWMSWLQIASAAFPTLHP